MIETKEITEQSSQALTVAKGFRITSTDDYLKSADMLKGIKALLKQIDDTFDPHIKRAFEAHRGLVGEKKLHQQKPLEAEGIIKRAVLSYQLAEEQKRREAEARAQEEARKEREKLEAQAAKAAAKGKEEKAAALVAAASAVTVPVIPTTTPRVAGISTRVTYKAVVVDKMELVKAVAAGTVPLNALDANMAFLNNQARVMKETLSYPGVKSEQEVGLASRSA